MFFTRLSVRDVIHRCFVDYFSLMWVYRKVKCRWRNGNALIACINWIFQDMWSVSHEAIATGNGLLAKEVRLSIIHPNWITQEIGTLGKRYDWKNRPKNPCISFPIYSIDWFKVIMHRDYQRSLRVAADMKQHLDKLKVRDPGFRWWWVTLKNVW